MMKKLYTLLSFIALLSLNNLQAQVLYSSTVETGFRFNPGLGTDGNPVIAFDDLNINSLIINDADSIGFTKIKVGIRQIAGAVAVTVNVYLTTQDPASFGLDSLPSIPPFLIGTFNLPANSTAAGRTQILSIGDSINVFRALARDTGNLATGFQTAYLGVSFSNNLPTTNPGNGWRFTSDGANFDIAWQYNQDDLAAPRTAFSFSANPVATFYAQAFGKPVYAPIAVDARLADVNVPQEVTCFDGVQTVTVQLENTGVSPIAAGAASVKLAVSGANTSTTTLTNPALIAAGATASVTFPAVLINAGGFNTFTASVILAADGRATNDTLITSNYTSPTFSTFPLVEDAEIFLDPVITWWESIAGSNAWNYSDADTGIVLPNRSFVDTLRAHGGTGFYWFDGFNAPAGVESRLFTNCIQLGAAASGGGSCGSSVSFWSSNDSSWADFGDDSLFVSVSTDKGASWTRLVGFSTLDLSVGTAQWVQNIVDLSFYNGQTIQIGFEGVSDFRQRFGLDDLEIISNCVVPVTLSAFTVQKQSKANKLTWKTIQELNSLKYLVQLSKDGRNFSDIGEVLAAGNSSTERTYSFVHNLPASGRNYYRVKIVDRDNKFKFTDIRSVQNLGVNEIAVSPNPVSADMKLSINADKADMATVTITDMSGKNIYSKTHSVAAGDNAINLNSNGFRAGNYIIKVLVNGQVQVAKFIKL